MYLTKTDISKLLLAESITILVLSNKAAFLLAVAPFMPFNIAIIIPAIIIGIIPAIAGASLIKERKSVLDPEIESFAKSMKIYLLLAMIIITVILFNLPFLAAIGGTLLKMLAIPCVVGMFGTKALFDYANLTKKNISYEKKVTQIHTPEQNQNDITTNQSFSLGSPQQDPESTFDMWNRNLDISSGTMVPPTSFANGSLDQTHTMYGNTSNQTELDNSLDNTLDEPNAISSKESEDEVKTANPHKTNREIIFYKNGLPSLIKALVCLAVFFAYVFQPTQQFTPATARLASELKPRKTRNSFLKDLSYIMNDKEFCSPTL